ncbi:DNA polymerase delta, subunit 4-domain-containing protein [Cristinia sonorae]|uniref:DNA polymerase delta, subunit 4-domain-containing protein n=1 Tax=Cristinia sonorae TaxID=1940300 RepID=A0A8K0UI50_9AGAR|nr:DNA polymerase delta, subunit 4-domain-containing protein [Cristinia sonorae]
MAPPKAGSSKGTGKSSGLTQTRLDFKAGRGSFTTKPEEKSDKTSRIASTAASRSRSASREQELLVPEDQPSRGFRPATKKRKLDVDEGTTASRSVNVSPGSAGTPKEDDPPALAARPRLNVLDKKYLKQYSQSRKEMGNLQPIHQEGMNRIHHILRIFDLSYQYGPCVGVTRLERWERAHALGLNPPIEVKDILMTQEGQTDDSYRQNVFHDYEV